MKARDFFRGLFTVDLAADEVIVGVRFTPARAGAYAKLRHRASHFAIVGVAAVLDVGDSVIQSARVGLTGATACPTRLMNVEKAVAGHAASQQTLDAAAQIASEGLEDINADLHASDEYRRAMVSVFTRRALEGALARAPRKSSVS